jgi:hypothetical protein
MTKPWKYPPSDGGYAGRSAGPQNGLLTSGIAMEESCASGDLSFLPLP